MAEDQENLGTLNAREYLLYYSKAPPYSISARASTTRSPSGIASLVPQKGRLPDSPFLPVRQFSDLATGFRAGLNVAPTNPALPGAAVSVEAGDGKPPAATASVGNELLNYERRYENGVTDTVSGKAGPFSAFYSKFGQPGDQNFEQTRFGGAVGIGPAQFYGQRTRSREDAVDPRYAQFFQNTGFDQETDTFGALGSVPLGRGTLRGGINRQSVTNEYPQPIGQDARPMAQDQNETNYWAGWQGPAGPGYLDLHGTLRDVHGGDSEFKGRLGYKLRF